MSFDFVDWVAASRPRPRPLFKAFRSRLVMNGDARRLYFAGTDRVLLAYDREQNRIGIKLLPPNVYEHEGWRAFHIVPQAGTADSYEIEWRHFWDREVGRTGGRPIVRHAQSVQECGEDVITIDL